MNHWRLGALMQSFYRRYISTFFNFPHSSSIMLLVKKHQFFARARLVKHYKLPILSSIICDLPKTTWNELLRSQDLEWNKCKCFICETIFCEMTSQRNITTGYYMVVRRYGFYACSSVKKNISCRCCPCHENIESISLSYHVMFYYFILLYRAWNYAVEVVLTNCNNCDHLT